MTTFRVKELEREQKSDPVPHNVYEDDVLFAESVDFSTALELVEDSIKKDDWYVEEYPTRSSVKMTASTFLRHQEKTRKFDMDLL